MDKFTPTLRVGKQTFTVHLLIRRCCISCNNSKPRYTQRESVRAFLLCSRHFWHKFVLTVFDYISDIVRLWRLALRICNPLRHHSANSPHVVVSAVYTMSSGFARRQMLSFSCCPLWASVAIRGVTPYVPKSSDHAKFHTTAHHNGRHASAPF